MGDHQDEVIAGGILFHCKICNRLKTSYAGKDIISCTEQVKINKTHNWEIVGPGLLTEMCSDILVYKCNKCDHAAYNKSANLTCDEMIIKNIIK